LTADTKRSILSPLASPLVLVSVLFLLNAYLCRELFSTEYLRFLDSIEGAYIGLARWIGGHPFEWKWFPQWYCGIPFQNAYPPLLHFIVAGVAALAGISAALAYHAVTAAFYCAGPVTLFLFAWRLSGDRWASFFAGLFYSAVSASSWLVPAIAADVGTAFASRRLHVLARYGEGPHVAALALLPVALAALLWALRRRKPIPLYATALAFAAVVLTNWLGAFALAAAVLCCLLATHGTDWFRRWGWTALGGLLAYAIAAPWIPPSTLADIRRNSQFVGGNFPWTAVHALYAALFVGALVALWLLLRRLRTTPVLQFSWLFFLCMGAPTLTSYWLGVYLVPQPHRYHIEMEIPIAMIVAFSGAFSVRRLPQRVRAASVAVATVFLLAMLHLAREPARYMLQPFDMETALPYQVSRWLDRNLPGERVHLTGTSRFWLNAFADNPQLAGGFDPGITNRQILAVTYGIHFNDNDGARAADWLRAYSVVAIATGSDLKDPRKFDGVLPEIWRDGDDAVYRLPPATNSLARVILADEEVRELRSQYVDPSFLQPFLRAGLDPERPAVHFAWRNSHTVSIQAQLRPDQLLAVSVTYHPGWRATVNGQPRAIRRDALGLMVIEPKCDGDWGWNSSTMVAVR